MKNTHINELTEKIIGAAIEVHKNLGPGLLESVYEECLCYELEQIGLRFQRQLSIPVKYKEIQLDIGYRLEIIIEDEVIIELKTVEKITPLHEAQLLTYLKITDKEVGLIMNFNSALLKNGIKRMINTRQ